MLNDELEKVKKYTFACSLELPSRFVRQHIQLNQLMQYILLLLGMYDNLVKEELGESEIKQSFIEVLENIQNEITVKIIQSLREKNYSYITIDFF